MPVDALSGGRFEPPGTRISRERQQINEQRRAAKRAPEVSTPSISQPNSDAVVSQVSPASVGTSTQNPSAPTDSKKRERVQLEIARSAGLTNSSAPEKPSAEAGETQSSQPAAKPSGPTGRIQEQLLKAGAGFVSASRGNAPEEGVAGGADSGESLSGDGSISQFQTDSQKLETAQAEVALATLPGIKAVA